MNIADLAGESDSSDEDYIPEGVTAELPSEEESDGEAEDPLECPEDVGRRGNKRQKKGAKSRKRRKTVPQERPAEDEMPKEIIEDKKQTDSLWADFMKDTGFKTRAERSQPSQQTSKIESNNTKTAEAKLEKAEVPKVKVKEIYKFAGEEVEVEKEVNANSAEARLAGAASSSDTSLRNPPTSGRLNSILNQLGKNRKINTLEKSKLDWEKFKKDEDIADELQAYGKSKDGYLERQDFLQRADLRRFEIEKEIRSSLRTNRTNNV